MAKTYTPISSYTVSGTSTNSVSFSSISGYTDLHIVFNGGVVSGAENMTIRFNSDTGTNYSYTFLTADGTSPSSGRQANAAQIMVNYYGYLDAAYKTLITFDIMNYSNSTTYKTVLSRANNAANGVATTIGQWRNTNAISTLTVNVGGNYASGSTITLYGIAAA